MSIILFFSTGVIAGRKGCTCGKNTGRDGKLFCSPGSRCPYLKQDIACTRFCRCKGCKNKKLIYLETGESQNPREDLFSTSINTSCRCGEDKVKHDANFVACNDGQKKSKCPCLKLGRPCKATCHCKNCANPIAPKISPSVDISPPAPSAINRKRKRTGTSHYKRVRSADYLISRNLEPVSKIWTAFEQSLLLTVTAFLASTLVSPSLENIARLYNHVAESHHCQEAGFPIRKKMAYSLLAK